MPGLSATAAAPGAVLAPRRFSAVGLPKWSAAVRRAETRQGRARLLCLGDSTTAGYGIGRAGAWPRQLADLMSGRGGRETAFFLDANLGNTYDPRMVRGAGWAADTTKSIGYGLYKNASLTTNAMTFTPQTAFDSVDVYLQGTAAMTVKIGSGTAIDVTGSFGSGVGRVTVTCAQAGVARGAHAVAVTARNTGGLAGVDCYDAASGVSVLNGGVSGWTAADFNVANVGVADTLDDIQPHLTLYNIGINDWATVNASWKTTVQVVIDRALAIGSDVLLIVPNHINLAKDSNRGAYAQYMRDLATANGLPQPYDLEAVLGTSWTGANAAGDMNDAFHPSAQGYGKIAAGLKARIA